jgi:hypothetical protein
MRGELLELDQPGRRVFSAGNVVTGKGNIIASRKHATKVASELIERFLGLGEEGHVGEEKSHAAIAALAAAEAHHIASQALELPLIDDVSLARTRDKVSSRQAQVGYRGDLAAWLASVEPKPAH